MRGPGHRVQCNVSRVPCTGLFEICVNNSSSSSSLLLRKEKEVSAVGREGKAAWGGGKVGPHPPPPASLKTPNPLLLPTTLSLLLGEITLITVKTQHMHFQETASVFTYKLIFTAEAINALLQGEGETSNYYF